MLMVSCLGFMMNLGLVIYTDSWGVALGCSFGAGVGLNGIIVSTIDKVKGK